MAHTISNSDDIIDSRDIIERIAELESTRAFLQDKVEEATLEPDFDADASEAADALAAWDEENQSELDALRAFAAEGADYFSDWPHGETLIRDSYFETYAQELHEDINGSGKGNDWPFTCIDWERAAHELQYDYSSVEFDGVTYWGRS